MRIFFLCPCSPLSPTTGAAIRTYHFIRRLSKKHEVGVWALRDPHDLDPGQSVLGKGLAWLRIDPLPASGRWRLRARGLCGLDPLSRWGFDGARIAALASRAMEEFRPDVAVFAGLPAAGPLPALARARRRPLFVYDTSDAVHVILSRALAFDGGPKAWTLRRRLETWFAGRVRRMEQRVAAAADLTLCVSDVDARALDLDRAAKRHLVIPNGVDTRYFEPLPEAEGSLELVFAGSLNYGPNYDAVRHYARDIHPLIRARLPGVTLTVVGKVSPELEALRRTPGLDFVGFQTDVRPYFRRAAASVAPLRGGSGTRFKILESWAMGRAVVSTSVGAEGLPAGDRANLLLADDPAAFSAAVVELLGDPNLRRTLSRNGRRLVEERFDWDAIASRFEGELEALVQEGR